jgi:hypothetical protein
LKRSKFAFLNATVQASPIPLPARSMPKVVAIVDDIAVTAATVQGAPPKCASYVCHETSRMLAPISIQADRPDHLVSDIKPLFAATPVIARRASAVTDSEIATSY